MNTLWFRYALLSIYTVQLFIVLRKCGEGGEGERDGFVLLQVLQHNLIEQKLLFFFFSLVSN